MDPARGDYKTNRCIPMVDYFLNNRRARQEHCKNHSTKTAGFNKTCRNVTCLNMTCFNMTWLHLARALARVRWDSFRSAAADSSGLLGAAAVRSACGPAPKLRLARGSPLCNICPTAGPRGFLEVAGIWLWVKNQVPKMEPWKMEPRTTTCGFAGGFILTHTHRALAPPGVAFKRSSHTWGPGVDQSSVRTMRNLRHLAMGQNQWDPILG